MVLWPAWKLIDPTSLYPSFSASSHLTVWETQDSLSQTPSLCSPGGTAVEMIAPSLLACPSYRQGVSGRLWVRDCASPRPYEASERCLNFSLLFKILSSSGARFHLPLKASPQE